MRPRSPYLLFGISLASALLLSVLLIDVFADIADEADKQKTPNTEAVTVTEFNPVKGSPWDNGTEPVTIVREKPVEELSGDEILFPMPERPLFPGCENIIGYGERKICADQKMLEFIYGHVKFPPQAIQASVEGVAVIYFIVEPDGSISDERIVRNPGAGTGEEALRVVRIMKEKQIKFTPARSHGLPVRYRFNLPVKFKLE